MVNNTFKIYSDKVWLNEKLQAASLTISASKITKISIAQQETDAINFLGKIIMPGVIDAHVHINEPGRTDWEGFATASLAAAKGGTTTLVDMPLNSSPVVTNVNAFQKKIKASKNKLFVNCGFWAGATNAALEEVKALIEEGCLGVKVFLSHSGIDEFSNITLTDLDILMKGIKDLNIPILAHCELDTLPADNSLLSNPRSYNAYLKSRPKQWENEAIKAFINLSEKHQCKAHIVHLASDEALNFIINKKKHNIPFTVETCPHYILFNAEEIENGNTLFKCAPPIRKKANGQHLRAAIKKGIIDFITTDHSPAPPEIKEMQSGDFSKAWGGIAGLQFLLSASWTALKEDLSLEEFIPLLTSKPAKFLALQNTIGKIELGYDADICIWNPEKSFLVKEDSIEHKHKATPYLNRRLFGKVEATIVNGQFAFHNEKLNKTPFGKRFLGIKKII